MKMLTRDYAVEAKRAMGEYKSGGLALRVSMRTSSSSSRPFHEKKAAN